MSGVGVRVGVDVGGTNLRAAVLDGDGRRLAGVDAPAHPGVDGVVDGVVDLVARALAAAGSGAAGERAGRGQARGAGVDDRAVTGVGVCLPGFVDPEMGTWDGAVNLGIAAPVPLADLLTARLGVPVRCENDLNAAVLGARRLLADGGTDVADLAFLALGTGLAAGLMLDGRLRRGAHRAAGEIGHLVWVNDGLPCACGQRGCLERYASGSALDAAWPTPAGVPAPVALFAAAAAGDPLALGVRTTFVDALAAAVRTLVLTCDVAQVMIGGGVCALGAPLLDALLDTLRRQAAGSPFLARAGLPERVRLAPAGVPVGALGAALVASAGPDEQHVQDAPVHPAQIRPAQIHPAQIHHAHIDDAHIDDAHIDDEHREHRWRS